MRHPGSIDSLGNKKVANDELILNRFEKVSFRDSEQSERWFLRKSPTNAINTTHSSYVVEDNDDLGKGDSLAEGSFDLKSENTPSSKSKRKSSDVNLSKLIGKRFSIEGESRNERKFRFGKCNYCYV